MSAPGSARNAKAVADALTALGSAYRGDWSDFDGRALRNELNGLVDALRSSDEFDAERWMALHGICPENYTWAQHCETVGPSGSTFLCAHVECRCSVGHAPSCPVHGTTSSGEGEHE